MDPGRRQGDPGKGLADVAELARQLDTWLADPAAAQEADCQLSPYGWDCCEESRRLSYHSLRYGWLFARDWTLLARGDLGGLGIGSKLSWNLFAGVSYGVGSVSFLAGYRIWSADYETGSGADRFEWDVTSGGPGLGIAFQGYYCQ